MDINNTFYLTCEENKCVALQAIVGGLANCFCALVSSAAKSHSAEPWSWPVYERELDNSALKYANIHLMLGSNTKGVGEGWERTRGERMRQNSDARVNEEIQGTHLRFETPQ